MTRTTALPAMIRASAPAVTALTMPARIIAADAGARTITGRILRFGDVGHTAMGPVRFAAGSLAADADASAVKLLVEHDTNRIVGYGTSISIDGDDVTASFYVAPGDAGDEVLSSAAGKLRDGLSVGVQVIDGSHDAAGVLNVTAGALREVSAVAVPAFSAARMSTVAASAPAAAQVAPYVAPVVMPGPAAFGGMVTAHRPAGTDYAGALARMTAGYAEGGPQGMLRAALSDVVGPTDTAGNQAARDVLIRPQWLGELWTAENISRPLIEAFGPKPLTSWKASGFRIVRPAFGVAEYAGRKADVPSPGNYAVEPVDAKARRIAGAHDFDRIFLDFGDRALFDAYLRLQTQDYGRLSESWWAAYLQEQATPAGNVASPLAALTAAAARFRTIGARVNVVAMAPDVFGTLLETPRIDAPWLFDGTAQIDGSSATVGGITFTSEESIAAGTVIVADKRAASFFEHSNPPISVEAVNIPNGGVDIGVFGYVAMLPNDTAALVKYTVGTETP